MAIIPDMRKSSPGKTRTAGIDGRRGDFMTSLAKGLEILAAFEVGHPLGNQELVAITGLPKTTVSRITGTLASLGYLRLDEQSRKYAMGARVLGLGASVQRHIGLMRTARPHMQRLAGDRVHGLVISATLGSFARKSAEDKVTFLKERIDPLKRGVPFRTAAEPVVRSMFASGSAGPLVDQVREVALSMSADTFCAAIEAIVNYDGLQTMREVSVPALLIAGAQDKVGRPDGMRELTAVIPGARFVCIEGAGHYSFAEQPGAFNAALLSFLDGLPQRAAA